MSPTSTTTIAMTSSPRSGGDAENRSLRDAGYRREGALDRDRSDVLAPPDDQVLGSPGDPEVLLVIEVTQIAGVQPTG